MSFNISYQMGIMPPDKSIGTSFQNQNTNSGIWLMLIVIESSDSQDLENADIFNLDLSNIRQDGNSKVGLLFWLLVVDFEN